MGKLTVIKSGLYTSIQDQGRFGYRSFGVPPSGFMDQQSASLANLLVNNPENNPLIEITLSGPEIKFDKQARIAICGANISPTINNQPIQLNKSHTINKGQTLSFGKLIFGARAYLAVYGLKAEKVLGSTSQYQGISSKSQIENGDTLECKTASQSKPSFSSVREDSFLFKAKIIEVSYGPEYELTSQNIRESIEKAQFSVGINNRMGYQLLTDAYLQNNLSILTKNTIPGTVQLTPSGKLIVLMRDGQVTGGYPRVLQLKENGINKLSQLQTGATFQLSTRNSL